MNRRNELEGTVRSWLRENRHEDADRVLDLVLAELDSTPQRRASWLARRFPFMKSSTIRFGFVAVAVVALAVIGWRYLPASGVGGGPSPTAIPSPSPIAFPSVAGALDPGTYHMSSSQSRVGVGLTLTVPDGWRADPADAFVLKGADDANAFVFSAWSITHVFSNACDWEGTLTEVGPTADHVTSALERIGGVEWSHRAEPTGHTIIDSYSTAIVGFSVPPETDSDLCDQGLIRLWADTGGSESGGWRIRPGQRVTVYVIDVDGRPVALVTTGLLTGSANVANELGQIVRSVRFDR